MANMITVQPTVDQESVFRSLIDVRIALSAKKDHNNLLEQIFVETESIYSSDGRTFYLREGDQLSFAIIRNDSMGIALGGTSSGKIPFPLQNLDDPTTSEGNNYGVITHVALDGKIVHVEDAYTAARFCFSGATT